MRLNKEQIFRDLDVEMHGKSYQEFISDLEESVKSLSQISELILSNPEEAKEKLDLEIGSLDSQLGDFRKNIERFIEEAIPLESQKAGKPESQ